MTITFHIPGKAVGKSMRSGRGGLCRYKTKPTRHWMKLISDLARIVAPATPWEGPVCVCIEVTRRPLKQSKAKVRTMIDGGTLPTTKPDLDNYAKAVCDAMSDIIYVDDAQIVRLLVSKRYGETEGTLVNVTRWPV